MRRRGSPRGSRRGIRRRRRRVPACRTTPPRRRHARSPCRRPLKWPRIHPRRRSGRWKRIVRSDRAPIRRSSPGTISCADIWNQVDNTPLRGTSRHPNRIQARRSRNRASCSSIPPTNRARLSCARPRAAPTCAGNGAGWRRTRQASSRAECRFPDGSRRSSRPTSRPRTRSRRPSSTGSRTRPCRPRRIRVPRCRDGANGR